MNIRLPTPNEIHSAYEEGEAAVIDLFVGVETQVRELANEVEKQAKMLKDLEARLGKNSRNSGKPPSSDGYGKPPTSPKRTESLRSKGQKPNGGQPGHEGKTLKPLENPDKIQTHEVAKCGACGGSLKDVEETGHEERQVFDIPSIRMEITAHRVEIKICPNCGTENRGEYPADVKAPVQYGNGVKTWASYFTHQHYIALERAAQIFEDLVHHRVSEAVVLEASEELSEQVQPSNEVVKAQLLEAAVNHKDESGLRVEGKLHWLHVTSTAKLTHYQIHAKRGQVAIDEDGILPEFKGTVGHDHWKPYFTYEDCRHALCNEHHLREAQYLEKHYEQAWAAEISALLLEIKQAVDEIRPTANALPAERAAEFEHRYDAIVRRGYEANPRPPPIEEAQGVKKKRGRRKQTPPLNFLDRLKDFKPQVLTFMYDFRVPFTNNQAEQDVRMMKVKQKVSGSFRTSEGASRFARIRGYISTARKNAVNVFAAIQDAFDGNPFIPSPDV